MQPPDNSPSPPTHTSSAAPPYSHAKPISKYLRYRDKRVSATSRDTCPQNLQRGKLRDGEVTQQTWKMLLWCATAYSAQSILHAENQQRMVHSEETFSKCSHALSQFESLCAGAKLCLSLVSFCPALKLNLSPHSMCTPHAHTPLHLSLRIKVQKAGKE